jgi:flagellar motor switch protein FliN/FliY
MTAKVQGAEFQYIDDKDFSEDDHEKQEIHFLEDVYLPVSIELGRTKMVVRDIVGLNTGSVIEFDKLAGETVDLLVNDKKFAEGEVVVIDEHFGIRITGLYRTSDILKEAKK